MLACSSSIAAMCDDLVSKLREARIVAQNGELQVEHQEVEPLRLLLFRLDVGGQRGDLRRKLVEVVLLQDSPRLWLGEPLDVCRFGRTTKLSRFIDATTPCRSDAVSDRSCTASSSSHAGLLPTVQLSDEVEAGREQLGAERLTEAALGGCRVQAEELEVAAVVEDEEALLVVPRPEQVRTKPRAASRPSARTSSWSEPA